MCGIFGIVPGKTARIDSTALASTVNTLFRLSEARGKESAGISTLCDDTIYVYKEPMPASLFVKTKKYRELLGTVNECRKSDGHVAIIGHSRLVTNGSQTIDNNNQPVVKEGSVCVHNGIIVNDVSLWERFPHLKREYDVDTEVILALLSDFRRRQSSVIDSVKSTFDLLRGATSIAVLFDNLDQMVVATNNGSLYIGTSKSGNCFIFASERFILDQLFLRTQIAKICGPFQVCQVVSKTGYLLDFDHLALKKFDLLSNSIAKFDDRKIKKRTIRVISSPRGDSNQVEAFSPYRRGDNESLLLSDIEAITLLRRCTKCLLPETFPFISYDDNGVCNYCHGYTRLTYRGEEALKSVCERYRKASQPDCIIAFSGGRDSSFTLHYVKEVLKMNPIAVSYDWGMLTDLGRRNQSRMTGALGVEHILISADIQKKRENIRKNVEAWLKSPELGTIPLFMAGDKQYFYYVNKIKRLNGIELVVMGENHYEKTMFKNGFAGVKQLSSGSMAYNVSMIGKLRMLMYYAIQYTKNPSYINGSIIDTFGAFISYFVIPHTYVNLFDFISWDEKTVSETLIKNYDWELAKDTSTTWRIGDGTASFYNYIYYVVAGFTESDTFRSNQIREGILSRETAWKLVEEENRPRYESIRWYCDTIGIDFNTAITRINSIKRLYGQKTG